MTNVVPLTDTDTITVSIALNHGEQIGSEVFGTWLLNYCDTLRVFLYGPSQADFSYLRWTLRPEVQVVTGALGATLSAFIDCENLTGYHLVMCPTCNYSDNYIPTMIRHVERYYRKAIVGTSGGYRLAPNGFRCLPGHEALARDMPVHELDTRSIAYHAGTVRLTRDAFGTGAGVAAGHALGVWAQRYEVPLISIQRPANWVRTPGRVVPYDPDPKYARTIEEPKGAWQLYAVNSR